MSKRDRSSKASGTERESESTLLKSFSPDGGYPSSLRFSRAREYHLYTPEGERYLDCILGGGAAVLGHNPKGVTQAVRNRLSAGPLVPAPGKEEGKLRQAVRRLFPSVRWVVPVYAAELPALLLSHTPIWRPFERELPGGSGDRPPKSWPQPPAERFLLVPSFPLEPSLLLFCGTSHWQGELPDRDGAAGRPDRETNAREAENASRAAAAPGPNPAGVESAGMGEAAATAASVVAKAARNEEPPSSGKASPEPGVHARFISPVFLAGVTKSLHLLASAYAGEPVPRKLTRQERDGWRHPLAEAGVWERRGIYFRYTRPPTEYDTLRRVLQERGILIPRDPLQPMVCPRIITSHERSLWEGVHSTL
ncbi:MAG: hypothetical protein ACLFPW_03245 [Spirochaetaceae bacterium]